MQNKFKAWKKELQHHLDKELLPFWLDRLWDEEHGGFLTQWDKDGKDSGVDEKSMLAHFRSIYSLSLAALHGHDHDGRCQSLATKGVRFAIERYWDEKYGGFYWLFDRKNNVLIDQKITYGHSFAIYALSTYTLAFSIRSVSSTAERVFDLLQVYVVDTNYGTGRCSIETGAFAVSAGGIRRWTSTPDAAFTAVSGSGRRFTSASS